jgi:lipid II:glycine glycyltransferase (peptidoglycan interpeptide bridge formation enzyme)
MSDAKAELKKELEKGVTKLQTLRDEVRVRLHLASLDLKDQWNKLEPHLEEVEKKAHEVTDDARAKLAEAVKKLEKLRESLR